MPPLYVYELKKKINHCIDVLYEAGEIETPNYVDFYQRLGGAHTTWQSAFNTGRLTKKLEETLSSICRFEPHPFWIDLDKEDNDRLRAGPNYAGRDTPHAFRMMLRRAWRLPVDHGLELRTDSLNTTDVLFGSLAIDSSGQVGTDGSLQAFLEVDVALFNVEDEATGELISYGFSKVAIQLVINFDTKIVKRLEKDDLRGATLEWRGTRREPLWELGVQEGLLKGPYYFTKAPLFEVDKAEAGASFKACLLASVRDGSLRRSDGARSFSEEKTRILELLMARGFGENEKGTITFGVQQLTIVRREDIEP